MTQKRPWNRSGCTCECDGGQRTRDRTIAVMPSPGGIAFLIEHGRGPRRPVASRALGHHSRDIAHDARFRFEGEDAPHVQHMHQAHYPPPQTMPMCKARHAKPWTRRSPAHLRDSESAIRVLKLKDLQQSPQVRFQPRQI